MAPAKPMSVSMTAELEAYIEALAARFGFDQSRQWSRFVRLLIVAGGRQPRRKRPSDRFSAPLEKELDGLPTMGVPPESEGSE